MLIQQYQVQIKSQKGVWKTSLNKYTNSWLKSHNQHPKKLVQNAFEKILPAPHNLEQIASSVILNIHPGAERKWIEIQFS